MNQVGMQKSLTPIQTSYEYLKSDMEQLSYISKNDILYLMLGG